MIKRQKIGVFILFLLISGCPAFSQVKNEADLKKQAARAFEDEDYATGFKLYSTLVSNYPKDPEYNYRIGVCALLSEADKKKPIQYLVVASRQEKEVEKEVFFYLGKAYHLNYQFDEALKYYSQYKQVGSSSMQKKLQVDREIQCCKNAKRLLSNLQELVILDKKQLSQGDYYRSYDLKEIGGKLLVKPVDFISAADKKKKDKSIIYMPPSKDVLYYASYGDKENNKDIYVVRRMPSGEWSKPESVGSSINTEYDEDYPFLHPNGNVLYFASKGHNSMGGYDIFKSEYDEGTRQWKTPVNLDFPINSPDDDYLFVTDSLEKIAFLSSSRQSPAGKIDVYKILTERRAAEFAFIKGTVIKKSESQNLQSKIKIKNIETGEDAGTFSAEANGEYSIKIPNGGKYIFTVETPGMPTQSEGVTIPVAYSYKPYRQTIEYENQKLIITNFFETNDKDENNYVQYIQLIEEKAKMNVNAGDFEINPDNPLVNNNSTNNVKNNTNENTNENKVDTAKTNNTVTTNTTTVKTNVNNKQLVEIAYNDAKDLQKEAVDLKKDATSAFSAANSKQDQANDKKQEVQETQNKINTETDPVKKQELVTQLEKQKQDADLYDKQAKTANNIAQQMEVDANNKQKEADLNLQYAKALEEADKTKNNKQAIAKLEGLQKQLETISKEKSKSNALVESIKADAQNKEQELKNTENKQEKINKEENDIKTQITDVDKQIEKTKDKTLIDNLKAQKEELTGDLNDKQKESQVNQTKINTLKEESDALKSQAEYASNIVSGKTTDTNNEVNTNTTNTVVTNNTNTVTTNNTNTVTTNSTVTTNTTGVTDNTNENTPASLFETKSKKFDDELVTINSAGGDLENNKKKSDILNQYVQATDAEIKQKKQELSKAKTADEKTALNKEIKQLNEKKTELQKEVKLVTTQVKEQEKQAVITAKNNNSKDSTKTNNNTVVTNNTPIDTAKTKIIADNDDPRIQNINTLITQSQNNFTEEKKVFSNLEYTDPKAVQLKKQADDKLNELYKNNTLLEQQLEQLKMEVAKENAGDNDKKIQSLNKQADDLSAQSMQLRRDAKTKTGAEKQTALNQILALEKQMTGLRYQAARLQYQSDDDNFETNKQAITQLLTQSADNQNPEVQQAQELAKEAEKSKKEASRLREEAEAQNETEAKIGALSNADEKEKEALKKQEEALALLKKLNPKANTTAASKEKQVEEIKTKLGKEVQSSINALKLLVDANKAEYLALHTDVINTEKKQGSKPEELDWKTKAEGTYKQATDDYAKLGTIKDDGQKRDYLLAINIKLEESITQVRNAKKLLNGEEVVDNTTVTTNTVNVNNNTVTTNTVDVNNNTVTTNTVDVNNNTVNTNTVSTNNTVTTNTVDVSNNTTNTNTVAVNNNTTNSNTVIPTNNEVKLSPQQTKEVKNSPEYQKYTTLQKDIVKYNNAVLKDESAAKEYKAKYEELQKEIADMPEIDLKKKKEKEAESYKTKADSLQSIANDTRMLAETKKQESDNFVEGLDKKTSDNIITVAANDTKTNNTEAPKKYVNYSPAFQNSANAKDVQLADLRDKTSSPENLKEQNQIITVYIKDIDTEIVAKKKQQTTTTDATKKAELAQQISNLQTRKKELTNEKTTNDNIIKFATNNNTVTTNTSSVATNTVEVNNNTVTTNTVDVNNNTVNTNTVAVNTNTVAVNTNTVSTNNNTVNTNAVSTNNNTVTTNTNTATISTTGFEVKNTNAYSNTNPIPVNEKLPDGLMFRVQIGAFKNPISPDRFAGLSPVGAESTNFGFIRYQVGMFSDYQKANAVKNDMRKLKYSDAFVVAYRNGKRISLAEALDSLAKTGQDVTTNANSTAGITTNNNIPVNPEATNTNQTPAVINGELNKTDGLLFTVQIGVYGDNVAASKLFNLKPVFKEVLPTGYFRYTAGIYNSIDKVKADRQKVNALGIQDAFVSAYLNGQRIKINEALDKINAGGAKFPTENPIVFPDGTTNNTPANNVTQPVNNNTTQPVNNVQPVTNGVTEGPAPTAENGVKTNEDGITFKVQIGAYSKQVPVEVVNNWLKIKSWPIKNVLVNGLYVYSIGSFTENKFARTLRDEVKSLGMGDAYVVVYKDGKKLYGAEATQYLNR